MASVFPLALLGKDARDQKAGEEAQNDNDCGGKLIKLLPACGVVHVHGGLQRLVLLDQVVLLGLGEGEGVVLQPLLEQTDPVGVKVRGILRGEGVGGEVVEGLEILGIGAVQQVPNCLKGLLPVKGHVLPDDVLGLGVGGGPHIQVGLDGPAELGLIQRTGPSFLVSPELAHGGQAVLGLSFLVGVADMAGEKGGHGHQHCQKQKGRLAAGAGKEFTEFIAQHRFHLPFLQSSGGRGPPRSSPPGGPPAWGASGRAPAAGPPGGGF